MKLKFLAVYVLLATIYLSCKPKPEENLVTIIDDSKFAIDLDSLKFVFTAKLNSSGLRKVEKIGVYNLSKELKHEIGFEFNGKVFFIHNYKDGIEDGRRYSFYPSGIIAGEFEYQNGIFTGRGREYDRNGIQVFGHSKINKSDTFDLAIKRDEEIEIMKKEKNSDHPLGYRCTKKGCEGKVFKDSAETMTQNPEHNLIKN